MRPTGGGPPWLGVAAVVAANLLVLGGVVAFGWSAATVLLTYWAETAAIGFWAVVGLLRAGGVRMLGAAVFVTIHFGMFMLVHGLFLTSFFVAGTGFDPLAGVRLLPVWAVVGLFVARGVEAYLEDRRDPRAAGFKRVKPAYARVFVMQITIIAGGFLVVFLGDPTPMVALLVVVKTGLDLALIRRTRRGNGEAATLAAE